MRKDLSTLGLVGKPFEDVYGDIENKVPLILVVGDGDFSYSLSLVRHLRSLNVSFRLYTTTLDTEAELTERYGRFVNIRERLNEFSDFVTVNFGVDACKLETIDFLKGLKFDRIVFNFPHYCGKTKNHINRKLIQEFFHSAGAFLERERGEIWVSLTAGQGGTPAETTKRRDYGNTWQVQDKGCSAGLLMKDVILTNDAVETLSNTDMELGYQSKGFRNTDSGFRILNGFSHVFAFPNDKYCPKARYPLTFSFKFGFYLDPDAYNVDILHNLIREVIPKIHYQTSLHEVYFDPIRKRHARTYNIVLTSLYRPLCKYDTHNVFVEIGRRMDELERVYLARIGDTKKTNFEKKFKTWKEQRKDLTPPEHCGGAKEDKPEE